MNKLLKFPILSYSYDFSFENGKVFETTNKLTPSSGIKYFVKDEEIMGLFGSEINTLHLDWIDVAIAVYVADRLSLRELENYRNNWKRKFSLKIEVRNIEIWLSQSIQSELKTILNLEFK